MLLSFDIPESREQRIEWLESQVAGVNLARLVAEFRAVHQTPRTDEASLQSLLGDQSDNVMQQGIIVLSDAQIQSLLKNPGSLFELQEQVLLEGSAHWQNLGASSEVDLAFDASLLADAATSLPAGSPSPSMTPTSTTAWYRHPALVSLVTAACVLIATNLYQSSKPSVDNSVAMQDPVSPPPAKTGWGWDRPDALQQDLAPGAYLNSLADAADDWFKKRPETPHDVAVRIAQFRQGCSTLILSDHAALAADDCTWLIDKCRLWAGKLDEHLAAVEAGEPTLDVRAAADETVNKLIKAIRERAEVAV